MSEKQDIIKNFSEMPKHQEGIELDYDDPQCLIEQFGFPTKDKCYVVERNGKTSDNIIHKSPNSWIVVGGGSRSH